VWGKEIKRRGGSVKLRGEEIGYSSNKEEQSKVGRRGRSNRRPPERRRVKERSHFQYFFDSGGEGLAERVKDGLLERKGGKDTIEN